MYRLLIMYHHPKDPKEFDEHYFNTHLPLALKIPNTTKVVVSKTGVDEMAGSNPYYMIAEMEWESKESMSEALQTPAGIASHDDFVSFAGENVTMVGFEVTDY